MHFTYGNPARATEPERVVPGARSLIVGARSYRRTTPAPPAPWGRLVQQARRRGQGIEQTGAGSAGSDELGAVTVVGGTQLHPEPQVGVPVEGGGGVPVAIVPVAIVARYARRDEYATLRAGLDAIGEELRRAGFQARTVVDSNDLMDRAAAHRAGLGWYGKNSLLLLPGRGSWFVLGSVVTDADLQPFTSPAPDGCGTCSRCQISCPTGALQEPGVVDARRCLAWLLQAPGVFPLEYRRALGSRIYGCDACQTVCPVNKREDRETEPAPAEGDEQAWVELTDLLGADDARLMQLYGRWYIPRRQPRYLRRNALIALGNAGAAAGRRAPVEAALTRALVDCDDIVRSHAVWAAAALGRRDLIAASLGDAPVRSGLVRAELDAAGFGRPASDPS